MHREQTASAHPILGNPDEFHICRAVEAAAMARPCKLFLAVLAGLILLDGLVPSVRYIYSKTKSPFSIHHYAQERGRCLPVLKTCRSRPGAPRSPSSGTRRIQSTSEAFPDPPYDTFICQNDAYSIIHLFLHDYDDAKILSFCSGLPFFWVMTEQDVWNANKRAILSYVPAQKDLKLIWERDPKTARIISEVPIDSRSWDRRFSFVLLWRESKDILCLKSSRTATFASFKTG